MKFVVDRMLGKLAKELRMLGYDTVYYQGAAPRQLIEIARQQERTILTRNTKLVARRPEDQIINVTEDTPGLQLKQLIRQGSISPNETEFFSRCLLCNALLDEIPRGEAEGKVPDYILYHQKEFFRCPQCGRIYWKGSHQEHMQKRVEELFQSH
jgi:uncharacterized protein